MKLSGQLFILIITASNQQHEASTDIAISLSEEKYLELVVSDEWHGPIVMRAKETKTNQNLN